MPGPLEGVKVVELGVWVAGPAAGGILADWGAEVIKIEPPAGDPSRTFQYSLTGSLMPTNPIFEMDNRSKRSFVLDLTTTEGREIAEELIAEADVLVTNVRLGGLERLGLDPDSVTARHPRLIYAAITGYGLEGDDRDRAAFDIAAFWGLEKRGLLREGWHADICVFDPETIAPDMPELVHDLPTGASRIRQKAVGIKDTLVRYSAGIESAEDLIADLEQGLSA